MTTALTVFNAQVDVDLEGISDSEYPSASRDAQIKAALERYSKDRPKEPPPTVDVSGDGGKYYEINTTTFPSWVEGFSRIILVEYPAATIASDEAPQYLEGDDWLDNYWAGGKRYLYLPNHSPSASEKMRITYSAPYLFAGTPPNENTDTPTQDFYAICHLAGGLCCQVLAQKYGQSMDPSLAADVVNYAQKSDFYARRAKELIALYEEHLAAVDGPAAAGVTAEWDLDAAPRVPYIWHGRKTR